MFHCCCLDDEAGQEVDIRSVHSTSSIDEAYESVHAMEVHPRVMSRSFSREEPPMTSKSVCDESVADSEESRSQKKKDMKQMALQFFRRAESGIAIQLLQPTAMGMPYIFQVDKKLITGFLRPVAGIQKAGIEYRFLLNDVDSVHKGADIAQVMPHLGTSTSTCVMVSTLRGGQVFVFRFTNEEEADTFFTCMTILRLSVNIAAEKSAGRPIAVPIVAAAENSAGRPIAVPIVAAVAPI